ncbi:MAG TPA: hypothetical protein VGJ44_15500 [Kribbellaceae bacterium]|jgi:hypothetical protein
MTKRTPAAFAAALVLMTGLSGCGDEAAPSSGGPLDAETVSFTGDAHAPQRTPTLSAEQQGKVYVVVSATTGCRLAESAVLSRVGDDLQASFEGGQDRPECLRPYTAEARFSVPAEQVRGVRTVQGQTPQPAATPALQTGFLRLGTLRGKPAVETAELGSGATAMYDALRRAGARDLAQVKALLDRKPAAGHRGFAYVLSGCAETGAVLTVSPRALTAKLTGGSGAQCVAAAYFLATFDVPAAGVAAGARPVVGR